MRRSRRGERRPIARTGSKGRLGLVVSENPKPIVRRVLPVLPLRALGCQLRPRPLPLVPRGIFVLQSLLLSRPLAKRTPTARGGRRGGRHPVSRSRSSSARGSSSSASPPGDLGRKALQIGPESEPPQILLAMALLRQDDGPQHRWIPLLTELVQTAMYLFGVLGVFPRAALAPGRSHSELRPPSPSWHPLTCSQ